MPRGVSRADEASLQQRLWTPDQLKGRGGMSLWMEAYDPSTISTSSGVITQWRDKSGRDTHFAPRDGSPTWDGNNVIVDTSNNLRSTNSVTASDMFPDLQVGLIVFVATFVSGVVYMKWETASSTNRIGFEAADRVDWPNDGTDSLRSWSPTLDAVEHKICSCRKTAVGKTVRLNGSQVASHSATASLSDGSAQWHYGCDPAAPGAGSSLKAWIITSHSDELTEMRLEGYLAWRIGMQDKLPASHPYRNAPPLLGV